MRWKWRYACLLLIFLGPSVAQEYTFEDVQLRPAYLSQEGSYPAVLVQTVPDATATATCLVMRYADKETVRPPAGAAHLLEHLLYRTQPGGKPGALLLRNETTGDSVKAWSTPTLLVFSELVPADLGLDSLKLQLSRLRGVPKDKEGLQLERAAIATELTASDEESAYREVLESIGYEPRFEGKAETLKGLSEEELADVYEQVSLTEDVVIVVVGPHTAREVRQTLTATLAPVAPSRIEPRERSLLPTEPIGSKEVESPLGYDQRSYFFSTDVKDPRVFTVAEALARTQFPNSKLTRLGAGQLRLDISPASADLSFLVNDLSVESRVELFESVRRSWYVNYESQQDRAEMLALNHIQGVHPERPVTVDEFSELMMQAKELLSQAGEAKTTLTLKPKDTPRQGLYPFRDQAHRSPHSEVRREKLPNGLGVTFQSNESFPIVALSGFFRLAPPLEPEQIGRLEQSLRESNLKMQYEVTPNGLFFNSWAPTGEAAEALAASAAERKKLAQSEDLGGDSEFRSGVLEEFFLPGPGEATRSPLRGKKLFRPQAAHLVVVGPVSADVLEKGLRPAWSGWYPESTAAPSFGPPTKDSEQERPTGKTVDLPVGSSPALVVGFQGPGRNSPDFLPFNLALQTLAGRPSTSLLSRKLSGSKLAVTSVKAFPLPASSISEEDGEKQIWVVALRPAETQTDSSSLLKEVTSALTSLAGRPLPEGELERTRAFLKSSLTLSASTIRGRARALAHAEFYRLSETYTDDFAGLYDHLKPDLIKVIARKYLESPEIRWIYFKPATPP